MNENIRVLKNHCFINLDLLQGFRDPMLFLILDFLRSPILYLTKVLGLFKRLIMKMKRMNCLNSIQERRME